MLSGVRGTLGRFACAQFLLSGRSRFFGLTYPSPLGPLRRLAFFARAAFGFGGLLRAALPPRPSAPLFGLEPGPLGPFRRVSGRKAFTFLARGAFGFGGLSRAAFLFPCRGLPCLELLALANLFFHQRQRMRQSLDVEIETRMGDLDPVSTGQLLQAIRQVLNPGHVGTVDEDGDDRNAAFKRRLDFDAHEVVGVAARRRLLCLSPLETQFLPMTTTSASHLAMLSESTSTKSNPSGPMLSMSKKTLSRPSRLAN